MAGSMSACLYSYTEWTGQAIPAYLILSNFLQFLEIFLNPIHLLSLSQIHFQLESDYYEGLYQVGYKPALLPLGCLELPPQPDNSELSPLAPYLLVHPYMDSTHNLHTLWVS